MESVYVPRHLWRWPDGVIAVIVLAIAAGIWWLSLSGDAGKTAVITTPDSTKTLSLAEDAELSIEGRDGYTVTLQIKDGQCRFLSADCPDQVCVHSGWLTHSGETAACVPAGVVLQIAGEPDIDGMAR